MGLYRWEGKRLRVVQVSPGAKRPVRFGEDQFPGVEPGGNVLTPICVNEYVLEPVANPTDASEPRRRTSNEPKDSDGPDPPR